MTHFFDPDFSKPNPSKDDNTFSEDVFVMDENGMHGLAYYNFADKKWIFHTNTLVGNDDEDSETKWKWYYPPYNVTEVFPENEA